MTMLKATETLTALLLVVFGWSLSVMRLHNADPLPNDAAYDASGDVTEKNKHSLLSSVANERWAVVQAWDVRQLGYPSLILSTNRALRQLGTLKAEGANMPPVDHVVVMVMTDYTHGHRTWRNLDQRCDFSHVWDENHEGHATVHRAAAIMTALGIKLRVVHDISSYAAAAKAGGVTSFAQLGLAFAKPLDFIRFHPKLFMWNFTEYDRLLWFDTDVLPLGSMLDLFLESVHRPSAGCDSPVMMAADVAAGMCYNSGVTLLRSSKQQFRELMHELGGEARAKANGKEAEYRPNTSACSLANGRAMGDQDFLQAVFQTKGCMLPIDTLYNTMVVSNKNALGRADGTVNWGGQVGGYLNMMFGTARHRKLLRAVHFGWPKPDMVKWMEPGSFFPIDQMEGNLSETKTAYISLFKTLWTQYRDAVNDACAVVRAAPHQNISQIDMITHNPGPCTTQILKPVASLIADGKLLLWCNDPPPWGLTLLESEGQQVDSYTRDTRIPIWQDL